MGVYIRLKDSAIDKYQTEIYFKKADEGMKPRPEED